MRLLMMLPVVAGLASGAVPTIEEILGERPWLGSRPMSAACRARYVRATDGESLHSYNVRHYRLDIDLPMVDRGYSAHQALSIRSDVLSLDSFALHFCNLVCDSVKRAGVPLQFLTPTGLLTIMLDTPLPQGESTVIDIWFRRLSSAPERGYYFATRPTVAYAYGMTCTPPRDCRYWMPCYDEPHDKAERGVELNLTVPDTFQTCANGLCDSVTVNPGNGTRTYWWRHPYSIATYLINFVASRFATWHHDFIQPDGDTVPSLYFMWPQDSAVSRTTFGRLPNIFAFYSDTNMLGRYPFEKYGQVPGYYGFPWGAMENQTLTMIHTQWLRSGDDIGMAHEMSHMWYGDMVTCVDFANIWLNEGFATYLECLYAGHANGRAYFRQYIASKAYAAILQDRSRRFPIYNPPEAEIYNYGTIYCKGAWVEHMLRWVLGDTAWESPGVFFAALRAYGDSFRYGTASTDDYCRINEQVSGQELSWFFDEWIYQAGYPKYRLNWSSEPAGDSFMVITNLSQANGTGAPDFFRTPLPVRVNCPGDSSFVVIRPQANPQVDTFLVAEAPSSLTVDPDNWILDSAYVVRTGVAEEYGHEVLATAPWATVVGRVLKVGLPLAADGSQLEVGLYDVNGRRVMKLRSGPNDVRALAPGTYFVCSEGLSRRVIVAR
ncbi:MAG: M1 family metallopeptidase [candidate division WOR-3 bacterium]